MEARESGGMGHGLVTCVVNEWWLTDKDGEFGSAGRAQLISRSNSSQSP